MQYWMSSNFRFEEEIAANIPQIKYLIQHNVKFNIEKRARDLSSFLYLWSVDYDEAKERLENIMDKIENEQF